VSGEYSVSFVTGMEANPADPSHIQASACCKHYAANSMEHTTEGFETHTRHDFDAQITQQDLVDSYLAPFQQW
jgi:beta-glucosidase-like glycosyl hydrolase